jgi:hypothetical protein
MWDVIKTAIAGMAAACAAIGALPFLASGGGGTGPVGIHACGPLEVILDTIRSVESGGNYQAASTTSSASGAYQFIDATWRHYAELAGVDTDRYPRAHMAPPADQDAAAAAHVNEILANHNDDVTIIPLAWYLPSAIGNPDQTDQIPDIGGNTLTPRQYQTRWLHTYEQKLAAHGPDPPTVECTSSGSPGPRGQTSTDGRWALPAPRDAIAADSLDDPHHDYPAWDLMLPEGTPVYAITDGTVVTTQHWDGNWWQAGCDRTGAPSACNTCGNGITIETATGLRHTYCHNLRLHVTDGDPIVPGQHIADSGDTGRSGAPHLHLELRIDGRQHCPQPLVAAIYHGTPVPAPTDLPTTGCIT